MATKAEQQEKRLQLEVAQVSRTKSILNANQIQKIFNSTPKRFQYSRPAKGGGNWTYVRVAYIRRTLDGLFGFNWSFIPETTTLEAFEVAKVTGSAVIKGTLVCEVLDEKGDHVATLKKGDYGSHAVKFTKGTKEGTRDPLDFGNDIKAANSDCIKRCAAQLGIAADLYDPDEFQDIEIIGSDETSAREEQRKKLIEDAKKTIALESEKVDG